MFCTVTKRDEMKQSEMKKFPRLDKSKLFVHSLGDDLNDSDFWISKSANARFEHVELLRILNYGDQASSRIQRVFEIAELP